MASVPGSYGANITVNWGAVDVTGIALAGSGNEYGTVNGVPCGDLVEIGTFTNAPAVGSSSLSNFVVFGSSTVGNTFGCGYGGDGFWSAATVGSEAGFAHAQIYIVVANTTTVAAASQVGIFYVSDSVNPNWRFPASTDSVTQTTIDIEDLLSNPGTPSTNLATGAQIIYGSGPVFDAPDAFSFLQLQQTNSTIQTNSGITTNRWSSPAGGKWEAAADWSGTNAPALSDTADFITNANTKTVTIDATTTSFPGTMIISNLTVSASPGSTNTLFLNNAGLAMPLDILNSFTISANGVLLVTNSVLRVDGLSGGQFAIDGGAVVRDNGFVIATNTTTYVGFIGVGQMMVSNGALLASGVLVGNNPGSQGTLTLAGGTNSLSSFLDVGYFANATGAVWVTGGQLIITNNLTLVGYNGVGQMTVSNGTSLARDVYIGDNTNSQGTLTIAGGTNSLSSLLAVGVLADATGAVWVTGGRLTVTNNYTDVGYSGVGQATVSNGTWLARDVYFGYNPGSRGTLTIAGGTNSLSSTLYMGVLGNATGAVWVTGGQLAVTNSYTVVGNSGVGQMTVSNGTWLAQSVDVGGNSGSQGTLTVAGGTNSISSVLTVGPNINATGAVWLTGGELVITNGAIQVGGASVGQMTISNGSLLASNIYVGANNGAQGTLTIAGGTSSLSSFLDMGTNPSTTGTVWLTGGQLITTSNFTQVGDTGLGRMTVSNGTWSAQSVYVGGNHGSQGTLTIAGGTTSLSSVLVAGNLANSTGAVWVTGGQLAVTKNIVMGVAGLGQMTVSNGTVTVASLIVTNNINGSIANTNRFLLNGGVVNSAGAAITNGLTFADGDGVDAATYHLLGGVHSFANGLRVRNNAMLNGCGTINGAVVFDAGSTVAADCGGGGNLNFNGTVTNNTTVLAVNGTTVNFYGLVVNNGVINATNGGAQFYGGVINTGTILTGPETNSWIDGSGKWENLNNWSRAAAPSISDLANLITNAGNNTVTINATTTNFPGTLTINHLAISAPLGSTNTLLLSDAGTNVPLTVSNTIRIDRGGSMVITDSAVRVDGPFGGALTVDGQLTLDSGTMLVSSNLLVGALNPQSLVTIWGGALYVTNAAHTAVSEVRYGTLVLTGGVYFTDSLIITNTGASFVNDGGTFTITGLSQVDQGTQTVASGTTQLSSNLVVGSSANSTGTVNVTGGQLIATNASITIGNFGVGSMTVSNGTVSTTGIDIGAGTNSKGTLTLQDGSAVEISSNLTAGSASGATGIVNVTGGQLVVTNGAVDIGNNGTAVSTGGVAQVTVSGGLLQTASILVGDNFGSPSSFTISGTGHVVVQGGLRVNGNHTTTVTDSGILDVLVGPPPPFEDPALNNRIVVANGADGTMIVSNGTVNAPEMVVGLSTGNTGTLAMNGGVVSLSSNLLVGMNTSVTGLVAISGGTLTVTNGTFGVGNNGKVGGTGGVAHVTMSGGLLQAASMLVGDNFGSPSSFTLSGSGHVVVQGGLRVNGNHTTTIAGGTLDVLAGPAPVFEDPMLRNRIVVAYGADGTLIVSDGALRTPALVVGLSAGNTGTLALAGGSTSVYSNMSVGFGGCTAAGIVTIADGALYVTNAAGDAVLDVSDGTLTLSSVGFLLVNKLVMTNPCGHFVLTGGTLLYNQLVLDPNLSAVGDGIPNGWKQQYKLDTFDPNLGGEDADGDGLNNLQEYLAGTDPTNSASTFRITSVTRTGSNVSVTWTMGSGKTNALQAANGAGYGTNGLADIFIVTNTVGQVTNYLDAGGATNAPARYYRVRLVP